VDLGVSADGQNRLETNNNIHNYAGAELGKDPDVDVDQAEEGDISLDDSGDERADMGLKGNEQWGKDFNGDAGLVASIGDSIIEAVMSTRISAMISRRPPCEPPLPQPLGQLPQVPVRRRGETSLMRRTLTGEPRPAR